MSTAPANTDAERPRRAWELEVIAGRQLLQEDISKLWAIDRSEVIDNVYYVERGNLVLKPEHYNMGGWPPEEIGKHTALLLDCFARGGWFYGLFDEEKLIGAAILDGRFIGRKKDKLQLKFLHVGKPHRRRGLGRNLFTLAIGEARERGAKRLYISAIPSENTVDFYRHLGCVLTKEIDPELLALEPHDIHLECDV